MDWQLIVVFGAVAGAVVYLGRAAWRSWRGARQGCGGGCACGAKAAGAGPRADRPPLIPLEQIRLRRRG